MKARRPALRGFSLTELLVVLACMAILATMLLPVVAQTRGRARETSELSGTRLLAQALTAYALDYGDEGRPDAAVGTAMTAARRAGAAWGAPAPSRPQIAEPHTGVGPSAALKQQLRLWSSTTPPLVRAAAVKVVRPYAEYEKAKYLLMSGTFWEGNLFYDGIRVKKQILANVPADVTVMMYVVSAKDENYLRSQLDAEIRSGKVKVVQLYGGREQGFWARDALPVPVWTHDGGRTRVGMVDARYYFPFEKDRTVARTFRADYFQHNYLNEGGNFLADRKGRCFAVRNDWINMTDTAYRSFYGCQEINWLPWIHGIGHIDETVKLLSDTVAVTDVADYRPLLQSKGFEVAVLPRPWSYDRRYRFRSYVNSLLLNGTLFVPVFGSGGLDENDRTALATYQRIAPDLKIVPINTSALSDNGNGSIHCITMTYPVPPTVQ